MILLIVICALLLGLSGFLGFLLLKALKFTRLYEEFYNSTIDDVSAILESLEDLMYRRQLISDDPDIRKLYKTISILFDILAGYTNASNRRFVVREKTQKEQQ